MTNKKIDDTWYPKNFDWYVKWAATVFILTSVVFRISGTDFRTFDLLFGTIGTFLWLWVSVIWKDRAMIILNVALSLMLSSALVKELL
jgi:hypothetical protein